MKTITLLGGIILSFFLNVNWVEGQTPNSQQYPIIKPGDIIRVMTVEKARFVGSFDHYTGDSITIQLRTNNDFVMKNIPYAQTMKIEVFNKTRFTPFEKVLMGTLIGAGAGAFFGLVVPDSPTLDNGGFYYWTRGGTILLWSGIGAGGGLIVGGVIAGIHNQWTPASVPGMTLSYSINIPIGWETRHLK